MPVPESNNAIPTIVLEERHPKHYQEYDFSADKMVKRDGWRTITGRMMDQDNAILIGGTIYNRDFSIGAVTDMDGEYTVEVPNFCQVLEFSYDATDYKTIILTNEDTLNVVLMWYGGFGIDIAAKINPLYRQGKRIKNVLETK